MRFYEILLEYKQDITVKNFGDKLTAHARSFENKALDPTAIVAEIEKADPTPNKQYMMWLIKQYLNKTFRLEDVSRISDVLGSYHKAKPRLDATQKDINKFTFYQLSDLVDSWEDVDVNTASAESTKFNSKNIKVLYDGPLGFLAIPQTKEASCELGRGTKWCTAAKNDNRFNQYNNNGPLYVFIERPGNNKFQFHFESGQFMDSKDRTISYEKLNYFRTEHPITKKFFAMKEKEIVKDPRLAYQYASNVIQDRWPEVEATIAKDPKWAYYYAYDIIQDSWPEGEAAIAEDAEWAYFYAKDVVYDEWPKGEATIAKDPNWAYMYARDVIQDRWPEGEAAIARYSDLAYQYAGEFDLEYNEKTRTFTEK